MRPDRGVRRTAARIFRFAAIYGVVVLLPLYFIAVPDPYRLTQLGFAGTALAFQGVFWVIGGDPLRFRAFIPFTVAEKAAFGIPVAIFYLLGRADPLVTVFGAIDLVLGALFLWALLRLNRTVA